MTTELEALLERMKPVARDQIVRVLRHSNTCIPTCRVLQAVLGHFKFQSFPVATEVTACNPRYAEMIMSLGGRNTAVEPTPVYGPSPTTTVTFLTSQPSRSMRTLTMALIGLSG
jgi:hypothetical protein